MTAANTTAATRPTGTVGADVYLGRPPDNIHYGEVSRV
jgi:hypothetical protein